MNRKHALLIALCLLVFASCRRIVDTFTGDQLLARVGKEELHLSDVATLFTPSVSPADSLALLESYVDRWVKQQLKIQQAELRFSASAPDIERQVREYRNSLLTNKLDSYYVEQLLDTVCSEEQIADYYDAHRGEYVLDRPLVMGRIVKVHEDYRQRGRLRDLLRWTSDKNKADFMGMVEKNKMEFWESADWVDYSDFLFRLPTRRRASDRDIFEERGIQEVYDGASDSWLYFIITDRLRKGDRIPLSRAREMIVRSILSARRAEVIRNYEDSIYRAGVAEKQIVIHVDTNLVANSER